MHNNFDNKQDNRFLSNIL